MEIATDDDKVTAPDDDKLLVRFEHLNWLHLRTIDIRAMRDLNRVWETLQAIRAVIPTIRWAAERVLDAAFFPIEWTGTGRVSKVMFSPQEWADAEIRELFGEVERTAAQSRAQSLLNLLKVMEPQVELQERECCQRWYAAGCERFAKLAPNAPALQLAMAGTVALSICLQTPATEPESGRITLEVGPGKYFAASYKYLTEPDAHVMMAATQEETLAAIYAVQAFCVRDILNRAEVTK